MTMRLALVIDGDASGAELAANRAQRAMGEMARQAHGVSSGARDATVAGGALTAQNDRLAQSFRNAAGTVAIMHGPLGGIASRLSATGMLMGRLGVLGATATIAIGGVTFAAQRGVRAFADYERQLLTTTAVIRATGGAAGRLSEDIDRLSREIGMGTLAATREVREASNQLMTFRSIAGDTFDRTLRLAQDLAAVGFGTVSSAAVQLGRALEDPEQGLQALTRVGITFSAAQREVIRNLHETGRTAEAQRAILEQVERQVGGAGAAAGQGLSGAFDSLTESTAEWFILVGANVATITGLAGHLRAVAEGVDAVNRRMREGTEGAIARAEDRLAEIRREEARLRAQAETEGSPFQRSAILRLRQLEEERQSLQGLVSELDRFDRARRQHAELRSQQAQQELVDQRFEAEIIRQQREAEEARLSELQRQVNQALRRAGVDPAREPERAAEIERLVRANWEYAEAQRAAVAAGEEARRAWEAGRQAVADLITALEIEIDVLRESDPVLQEMIRNRETLTFATITERQAIEELIRTRERERETIDAAARAQQFLEQQIMATLDAMIFRGEDAVDVMLRLAQAIAQAALQAALFGSGPLGGLFGGSGIIGGIIGSFAGGFASGGTLRPGQWGIVGEAGPEPIRALPGGGVQILPTSTLPAGAAYAGAPSGGSTVINHFHIQTANPRSFAEDRVAVLRGAQRISAQAARLS